MALCVGRHAHPGKYWNGPPQSEEGGYLPLDPPPLKTKVAIMGNNNIYNEEHLLGSFWNTNFWAPGPPPLPLPPLLILPCAHPIPKGARACMREGVWGLGVGGSPVPQAPVGAGPVTESQRGLPLLPGQARLAAVTQHPTPPSVPWPCVACFHCTCGGGHPHRTAPGMDGWLERCGGRLPGTQGVKLWLLNVPASSASLVFPSNGNNSHRDPSRRPTDWAT